MAYAGVGSLAEPTLAPGESVADFLASDERHDPEELAQRDFGFVRLNQLAVEHLVG